MEYAGSAKSLMFHADFDLNGQVMIFRCPSGIIFRRKYKYISKQNKKTKQNKKQTHKNKQNKNKKQKKNPH